MSHDEFPLGAGRQKALRMAQHRQSVMEKEEESGGRIRSAG
jgi:hypothetical protein